MSTTEPSRDPRWENVGATITKPLIPLPDGDEGVQFIVWIDGDSGCFPIYHSFIISKTELNAFPDAYKFVLDSIVKNIDWTLDGTP